VHDKQVRRRRAVLGLLVGASLILLTAYFGESPNSPLHSVQRGIVEVFSPIQEGASKVLSPVKDIAGWFSDTLNAKSQRDQYRREVAALEVELAQAKGAELQNQQLRSIIHLDDNANLAAYGPVAADVVGEDPDVWYQTLTIDKGSDDGVHMDDPVVGAGTSGDAGGLVGKVTTVGSSYSTVTELTDNQFGVGAEVQDTNGDRGLLQPQAGNPNALLLTDLPSQAPIYYGQQVVTSGFVDPADPAIRSLYPPDIPIGLVSSSNNADLLANSQEVHVQPFVDFSRLSVVQVLTKPSDNVPNP
jgi:rod shape-determining protein MreC